MNSFILVESVIVVCSVDEVVQLFASVCNKHTIDNKLFDDIVNSQFHVFCEVVDQFQLISVVENVGHVCSLDYSYNILYPRTVVKVSVPLI